MQIGGQYHAQTTIYGDIRVVDIKEVIQLCPQLVPEFHPFLYCLVLSGVGPAAGFWRLGCSEDITGTWLLTGKIRFKFNLEAGF